jgi:hypothetical protein
LLLQAAYSNYQIGAFENFHQLVEDTLIVLRPGPKVFFQYELGFVNRVKSQLLISHLFLPIKQMPLGQKKERKIKPLLGDVPAFLNYSINFCFNVRALRARSRWLPRLSTRQPSTHQLSLIGASRPMSAMPRWRQNSASRRNDAMGQNATSPMVRTPRLDGAVLLSNHHALIGPRAIPRSLRYAGHPCVRYTLRTAANMLSFPQSHAS